jgi:2-polyprenyl-6-methoxyphenol hydroxylase-like FAD-dependent oxidoreductase
VPQGLHAHGILARGREVIEEFFPGLTRDLVRAGAVAVDIHDDIGWYNGQRPLRGAPSDLLGLSVSRPALEDYVRERVRKLPNVVVRGGYTAVGLLADDGRRVVGGVRLVESDGPVTEDLVADLVVDATGRGNRGKTWLAQLGYDLPREDTVRANIAYATRQYARVRPLPSGKAAMINSLSPSYPYSAVLIPMEDDRWILTLIGIGEHTPPTDVEGFNAFAHQLPMADLHDVVDHAEPLISPRQFRVPASVRRRYERLRHLPQGYLVVGDALCAFNPVYGQGITVAAREALLLSSALTSGFEPHDARKLLRRFTSVTSLPWSVATNQDVRFPTSTARPSPTQRLLGWWTREIGLLAAHGNGRALDTLNSTYHLMGSPAQFLHPALPAAAIRARVTGYGSSAPRPPNIAALASP